jgi:hypothetical protein
MPTQAQLRRMVEDFERDYPNSLPERLKWWSRELGIEKVRLFRLLGMSATEAKRTPWAALKRAVSERKDRAEQVDEMLGQILASYDYNLAAMKEALHPHENVKNARPSPMTQLRRDAGRLQERTPLEHRTRILLSAIAGGGPAALSALTTYLLKPEATG